MKVLSWRNPIYIPGEMRQRVDLVLFNIVRNSFNHSTNIFLSPSYVPGTLLEN